MTEYWVYIAECHQCGETLTIKRYERDYHTYIHDRKCPFCGVQAAEIYSLSGYEKYNKRPDGVMESTPGF